MSHRKCLLFVLSVVLLTLPLSAQQRSAQDSLEQEILAHPETDLVVLGKSRAVLLESLEAADTAKARKVVRYMESRFDTKKMVLLYPPEQLLVAYWLGDYYKVLSFARTFDAGEQGSERIVPTPDQFYDEMLALSRKYEGSIRMNIRRSDLAPHERDFVLLLLTDILGRERGDQLQQEAFQRKLNEEADSYLSSYANSEYNPYVRKYIRFVMVKSLWGYGFGGAIGYLGLPNTLGEHLGDYGFLSLYAEGAYKQAYAYLGLDIGIDHGVSKSFEYNGTWPEGLSVMHTSILLAAGPMIELGSGFLAIPMLGISYMDFSPPETEKEKTGIDVSMSFPAWALGASFRIPLGGEEGGSFITINAGYRKAMTDIEMAKGGYSFLSVGFGLFGRPEERDL
jgi:hypothetical protein